MRAAILVPFAFLLGCPGLAAADSVRCPARIDVRQQIAAAPVGWTAGSDDAPHVLAGITFFDGNPADKASLAPDKETKSGGKIVSTWSFAGPTWLVCRYAGTSVTLMRELPKPVHSCTVRYDPRQTIAGLPEIETFDCR